jgi:shikimate dehydrogenase
VSVCARRREQAEVVASAVESETRGHLGAIPWSQRAAAIEEAAIVVNATPLGQHPDAASCPIEPETPIPRGQILYDLVYHPLRTRFLHHGDSAGAVTIDGLGMLLAQGIAALELWLGAPIAPDVIDELRPLCEAELERRRAEWAA